MKRQVISYVALVLGICVILPVGCYVQMGGLMMWTPRYDEKNLLGLTSEQVVRHLGDPSFDPRVPFRGTTRPSWTSEEEDGPLVLGYYRNWATCRIEFKKNRVVSVDRYWK
jgi:hypothetical protein